MGELFAQWRYCSGLRPKFLTQLKFAKECDSICSKFMVDAETDPKAITNERLEEVTKTAGKMFNAMKDHRP